MFAARDAEDSLQCVTVKHSAASWLGSRVPRDAEMVCLTHSTVRDPSALLHGLFTTILKSQVLVTVWSVTRYTCSSKAASRTPGPDSTSHHGIRVPIPLATVRLCVVLRASRSGGCSVSKSPGHVRDPPSIAAGELTLSEDSGWLLLMPLWCGVCMCEMSRLELLYIVICS